MRGGHIGCHPDSTNTHETWLKTFSRSHFLREAAGGVWGGRCGVVLGVVRAGSNGNDNLVR